MDFMDDRAPALLTEALGGAPDLVLSDMAANTVGHQQPDHLRTMALVEAGAWFAAEVLRPVGAFVAQLLAGRPPLHLVPPLTLHFPPLNPLARTPPFCDTLFSFFFFSVFFLLFF